MSPEQTEGRSLDRRSDIFALGTVLHETISGHRLFSGESPAETVLQILTKVPPPLHRVRAGVPESLSAIVARCLEKRPDARFPTAEALASALRDELRERVHRRCCGVRYTGCCPAPRMAVPMEQGPPNASSGTHRKRSLRACVFGNIATIYSDGALCTCAVRECKRTAAPSVCRSPP